MMESWLLPHKDTLNSIKLGPVAWDIPQKCVFNATLFPKLSFLQTSKLDMSNPVIFTADCTNLLGPNLMSYCWDWTSGDYEFGCSGTLKFGDAELLWIEALARSSIALHAALKTIVIKHVPLERDGYPKWDVVAWWDAVHRWDALHNLRDRLLRPLGISLVYDPLVGYENKDNPPKFDEDEKEKEEEVEVVDDKPQTPQKYHGEPICRYFKP
jgi:hypothetical protein